MRSFSCPVCAHLVVFANSACLNCGTPLGYSRDKRDIVALDGMARCANADVACCNWLVGQEGQLCHETGHWYWTVLVEGDPEPFRALFGDERADYTEALQKHYAAPAPTGWEEHYVSSYATAHPWEDWAESFAHYLHIRDTLQTAAA